MTGAMPWLFDSSDVLGFSDGKANTTRGSEFLNEVAVVGERVLSLLEFNSHWYDDLAGTRSAHLGYVPFYYLYSYLLCYDLSSTSTSLCFDPYTLY